MAGAGAAGTSLSASGGAAGPARSGLTSDQSFNVGGNAGIGSSQGISSATIAIIAVVGFAAVLLLRKG